MIYIIISLILLIISIRMILIGKTEMNKAKSIEFDNYIRNVKLKNKIYDLTELVKSRGIRIKQLKTELYKRKVKNNIPDLKSPIPVKKNLKHSHYWIKDNTMYESYYTLRGMRYRTIAKVNYPDCEKLTDLNIAAINAILSEATQ